MKTTFFVSIILIVNFNLYSQKSKNRLVNNYYLGIEYYLSPDTNDFKREILFVSMPSFNSHEYSLALEKKNDDSILKLRSFKSNYWGLVFSRRSNDTVMVTSKIDSFAVSVTDAFADKLISLFQLVLPDDLASNSRRLQTYDGTTYYISNNKYKREVRENDFTNKNYYNLVVICESMSNNLKKGEFNEIQYFDLIDKTFSPEKK
jgi:hypothetical protein